MIFRRKVKNGMHKQRGFQRGFCTFALILLAIVGCWQLKKYVLVQKGLKALCESAPSEKFEYIHKFYYHVNKKFEKGMSKDAVRAIIGSPQNTDSTYIWIWCEKMEESVSHSNWFDMAFARDGYYLIFYDDKLLTDGLRKAAEGWDWDVLANKLGIGVKDARKILMEEQAPHR